MDRADLDHVPRTSPEGPGLRQQVGAIASRTSSSVIHLTSAASSGALTSPSSGARRPRRSPSASFGPEPLESADRVFPGHLGYLGFRKANTGDQEVNEISGQRLSWSFGCSPVWPDALLRARPEHRLVDLELVAKDVSPDAGSVVGAINWMGNSGAQHPSIGEMKFVGDVVGARSSAGITHLKPLFVHAERLVILAGRLRPGHLAAPTSHSRSWSSSLKLIS